MTLTNGPRGNSEAYGAPASFWQPRYTEKEALRLQLLNKQDFAFADLCARTIAEDHMRAGTPRDQWEPNSSHIEQIVGRYISAGEGVRDAALEAELDPVLDLSQAAKEDAVAHIEAAEKFPSPITIAEHGPTLSGHDAADTAMSLEDRVENDYARGRTHHKRVRHGWKTAAAIMPWAEAISSAAFLAWNFDVPVDHPWQDWFGFFLTITIVTVVILGQTKLVHHAAEAHNQAREAAADGNAREAEAGFKTRNRWGAGAACVALVITGGLIYRSLSALSDAGPTLITLIVLLAMVTGLLMPTIVYCAHAFDGSRRSRQLEAATQDLEQDASDQEAVTDQAAADLQLIEDNQHLLVTDIAPRICQQIQTTVDQALPIYNFIRLQVGGLSQDPPAQASRTITADEAGAHGMISTGIPGARTVDLLPLFDRLGKAKALGEQQQVLRQRLDTIPAHPWAKND